MNDDAIRAYRGENDEGWSFEVYLFRGQPAGEVRFAFQGVPKFTTPIGIEEIAMFEVGRVDLIDDFLNRVVREHRPH